jgi:hypothetical protein
VCEKKAEDLKAQGLPNAPQWGTLLDTKGPEVRTAMLKDHKAISLEANQEIIIEAVGDRYTTFEGYKNETETRIGLSYAKLCQSVSAGACPAGACLHMLAAACASFRLERHGRSKCSLRFNGLDVQACTCVGPQQFGCFCPWQRNCNVVKRQGRHLHGEVQEFHCQCCCVATGNRILVADGTITIKVEEILSATELRGIVMNSKSLGERKNCNLPGGHSATIDSAAASQHTTVRESNETAYSTYSANTCGK